MNKNLKKVISAVAALALSASSFVALAANYPDVDSSASYKQAVDELSALNIINGYEDGTFGPDKLVTRAEFSKMVITALGSSELAQAEAATGSDTQFTDVPGTHWASGYVTAAVSNGIINGMGDGTFAPDANVTYAQAMKMLVCAAGYEQWSLDKGGWPNGYLYYANQVNIGSGVKDVSDSTEITRAQVAQMIDNTLTAPVCVNTNEYSYDAFGNRYAKLEAKDGYGIDYQNILTKRHDAYKVKGTVTGTNKSTGGSVKADEVNFKVQVARNWLDEQNQISRSNDNAVEVNGAKIGDSGADQYLKKYVEAIIQETDDDEFKILSVALAGQNEEITLAAEDFDNENVNYYGDNDYVGAGRLYFYSNSKTTSYKIDPKVELYVNGTEYDGDVNTGIDRYVVDNNASDLTLIDVPGDNNSTDGLYDIIMVDYYITGVVDTVDTDDAVEPTINFLAIDGDASDLASWDVELDNDDLSYTFTKNGAAISPAELNQYDVLSIRYDINQTNVSDSSFFDVIVATESVEGKYTLYNEADEEYTINGTVYKMASTADPLESGTTYTLYIDAFGRIAYAEEGENAKNIAILDSAYDVRGGEATEAKLIFADGSYDTYEIKSTSVDYAKSIVYDANGAKKDVSQRVVNYSINSSNEVTIKDVYAPYAVEDGEYKATQGRIGSAKISTDITSFVSAEDQTDIKGMSISTLTDGNYYDAYCYNRSTSEGVYRFVIITTGAGQANASTRVAVYQKKLSTENDYGDLVDAYQVLVNGEQKVVNFESGVTAPTLVEGAAIIYDTNSSGEVIKVHELYKDSTILNSYGDAWYALMSEDTEDVIDKAYVQGLSTTKLPTNLFFGPIVDKSSSLITVGEIDIDNTTDTMAAESLTYASDVNVYVVDYNQKTGSRTSVSTVSAVTKVTIPTAGYDDAERTIINWNNVTTQPRLALVKSVDGDASDIIVIIPQK